MPGGNGKSERRQKVEKLLAALILVKNFLSPNQSETSQSNFIELAELIGCFFFLFPVELNKHSLFQSKVK